MFFKTQVFMTSMYGYTIIQLRDTLALKSTLHTRALLLASGTVFSCSSSRGRSGSSLETRTSTSHTGTGLKPTTVTSAPTSTSGELAQVDS